MFTPQIHRNPVICFSLDARCRGWCSGFALRANMFVWKNTNSKRRNLGKRTARSFYCRSTSESCCRIAYLFVSTVLNTTSKWQGYTAHSCRSSGNLQTHTNSTKLLNHVWLIRSDLPLRRPYSLFVTCFLSYLSSVAVRAAVHHVGLKRVVGRWHSFLPFGADRLI